MAWVPADRWLIAFGILAGAALLASLLLALLFVFIAHRLGTKRRPALAYSFAAQAIATLAVWLLVEDPTEGLRFYAFILAPIAVAHILILPFLRKA